MITLEQLDEPPLRVTDTLDQPPLKTEKTKESVAGSIPVKQDEDQPEDMRQNNSA
jgi:hypothetical protein